MADQKGNEEIKPESYFNLFKPFFYKLLVYSILLVLSFQNNNSFHESLNTFSGLIDRLNSPILIDIKFIPGTDKCPENYTEINKEFINNIDEGCICDNLFYKKSFCENMIVKHSFVECNVDENIDNNQIKNNTECPLGKTCCNNCFRYVQGQNFTQNNTFNFFFDNTQICLLYSKTQSTYTYLKSVDYESCDPENVCNVYFCKFENKKENPCPMVYYTTHQEVSYDEMKKTGNINFISLSDNYLKFNDYDNYGIPKFAVPIKSIKLSRNKPCINSKTRFIWDYPLMRKEQCLHSDLYYEIEKYKFSIQELVRINNMEEFFDSKVPYYQKYVRDNKWSLYLETAINRFFIYNISKAKLIEINSETTQNIIKMKKEKISSLLQTIVDLSISKYIAEKNQQALQISAVILVIFEILFILLKILNLIFIKLRNYMEVEEIKIKMLPIEIVNEVKDKESHKEDARKSFTKLLKLDKHTNKNSQLTVDSKNLNLDKIQEQDEISNENEIANSSKSKSIMKNGTIKFINEERDVNNRNYNQHDVEVTISPKAKKNVNFINGSELSNNNQLNALTKQNTNQIANGCDTPSKNSKALYKENTKDDNISLTPSKKSKSSIGVEIVKKSKSVVVAILKFLNKISGWLTFIIDWSIFLICFVTYIYLNYIADKVAEVLELYSLDYDSQGQLNAFRVIILDVAFQSYEIMFLVLVRLFLIFISVGLRILTKGHISWNEFITFCCDNEEESKGKLKENKNNIAIDEAKVNTAVKANLNKTIIKSEYLLNIEAHKLAVKQKQDLKNIKQ